MGAETHYLTEAPSGNGGSSLTAPRSHPYEGDPYERHHRRALTLFSELPPARRFLYLRFA